MAMPKIRKSPTRAALARELGISRETVQKDARKGMPTDSAESARRWREQYLEPRREPGTVADETRRLKRAKALLAEIEAREKIGQLISVEDVRHVISAAAVVFASQMEGVPGRVANELAGITDPALIRHRLRDEIRRIREAVSTEFGKLSLSFARRSNGAAAGPDS